jgi:imidazoleglycerol-phosphate dehydratase
VTRTASLRRTTAETDVALTLDLDGSGTASVETGVGFWDHLLTSFAHHGLIDLELRATGDLEVDDHHTVEDTAMVLGRAVAAALGEREGIHRFGHAAVPMDEALATAALDAGGRPYAVIDLALTTDRIGALTTQNLPHALEAFAREAGLTLHLTSRGRNDHHVAEAALKALARALRAAVELDPRRRGIASTKGITA